eukprot:jgi/Ulvmu1/8029/UM004_0266.1
MISVPRVQLSARPALRSTAARRVAVRADPMQEKIQDAISAANKACDDGEKEDCATAWDEVEELSAAASHKADATAVKDPLEEYCETAPDADECRVYED